MILDGKPSTSMPLPERSSVTATFERKGITIKISYRLNTYSGRAFSVASPTV